MGELCFCTVWLWGELHFYEMRFLAGEIFLLNWYFFLLILSFFCEPNKNVLFRRNDCEPSTLNNMYCWYIFTKLGCLFCRGVSVIPLWYNQDTTRPQPRYKTLFYPWISYIPCECVDFMVLHAIRALLATDWVLKIKIDNKQQPKPTNFLKKKPCNAQKKSFLSKDNPQYFLQKKTPRQNKRLALTKTAQHNKHGRVQLPLGETHPMTK